MKKEHEEKCMANGGAAKMKKIKKEHKKKSHEAHGSKAKERSDKRPRRATGGKIATPKSPLSGAEPSGLPGAGKGENTPDKEND